MDFDEYESLPNGAGFGVHMTAGAIAGIMEHCIMYPLDSVKTRMQSMTPNPRATYRSVSDGLYKMMRYEGVMRPVRGMAAVVGGAGPAHALYFSCYEELKRILSTGTGHHHLAHGGAGCVATLLHDAIMGPADVIKQRMQMYNSPYRNCVDCVRATYRAEGMRAFYRSYTTQLLMNVPFQCIHFMMYEFAQDLTNPDRRYDPMAHMASGALAGGVAAAITTPLDVCKTLLNTQEVRVVAASRTSGGGGVASQRVDGLLSALRCVYRCRGFRGYFQGLQARVLFQMPSTAIAWSIYEFFKFFLGRQQQQAAGSSSSSSHHGGGGGGGGSGGGGASATRLQASKSKGTAVEGVAVVKPSHYANVLLSTSSDG